MANELHGSSSTPSGQTPPKDSSVKHQRKFYAVAVLLDNLNKAYIDNRERKKEPGLVSHDDPDEEELFQDFVCRLGQICDSRVGGTTVTAFAILKRPSGIEYIFASNCRSRVELSTTKGFVRGILERLRDILNSSDPQYQKDSQDELLSEVLLFNRDRIKRYAKLLFNSLKTCLEHQVSSIPELYRQGLNKLYDNCPKISGVLDDDQYDKKIVPILEAIEIYIKLGTSTFVLKRSCELNPETARPWKDIRHTANRLLSYKRAVETLVKATHIFPDLWHDEIPTVIGVSSSKKHNNPLSIQQPLSAAEIMERESSESDVGKYLDLIHRVESTYPLNDKIAEQWKLDSFKFIIHAEVLLLNWVRKTYGVTADCFFNDWKYIGCSKPLCRLCHEYFANDYSDVKTRGPHGNLYLNWRIPDSNDAVGSPMDQNTAAERTKIFQTLEASLMKESVRILDEKNPGTRTRDSATISSFVPRSIAPPSSASVSRPATPDAQSPVDKNGDEGE